MKNLNICIDIDGTITDAYYWLDFANLYFNKNITKEQITEYKVAKVMGIEEKDYLEFYEKNKFKIHLQQELREDAKMIINKLNLLHNIYFITARSTDLTMLTHRYLRRNGISYDELFVLGSHYKVDKASQLNCDIFIEDYYDNAIQLSNAGYKVLLIDTYYNRKPLSDNIMRVYSWKEISAIIGELFLQSKAI